MLIEQGDLIDIARNHLSLITDTEGYVTFLRFTEPQLAVYEQSSFFRLMSICSAGVCLDFETTGDEIVLDCKTAELGKQVMSDIRSEMTFSQILRELGNTVKKINQAGGRLDVIQHVDCYVDGCYMSSERVGSGEITLSLPNPEHLWRHVRIWLPLYKPFAIRSVCINGEWRRSARRRLQFYAFGDSITQGFFAGKPSLCYVSQLAELLDADALNQGIGGYTFNADILTDCENLPAPDWITVAYGTNDWAQSPDLDLIETRASQFFTRLHEKFPQVPAYVITPIWRDNIDTPKDSGRFVDVTELIRRLVQPWPQIRLIDGLAVSPHNPICYADGWLHPNIIGFSYLAARIYREIVQDWRARSSDSD